MALNVESLSNFNATVYLKPKVMIFNKRRAFAALVPFAFLSLLTVSSGMGQTRVSSPADLIQFPTYQSGRPRSALPDTLREAGKDNLDYSTNLKAAKSLADLAGCGKSQSRVLASRT
jgi:hypothetical protein